MRAPILLVTVLLSVAAATAQAPAFDVVSIKENPSDRDGGTIRPLVNGRWQATNIPARALLSYAWDLPTSRVLGGPDWLPVIRYDITAVASAEFAPTEVRALLRALLHDRFKIQAHVERRVLPTYNLVLARDDGRLGSSLRLSPIRNCLDKEERARALALTPPARDCFITFGSGTLTGTLKLDDLTGTLTLASGREVFNRTGLSGNYEVDLRWTPSITGEPPRDDTVSIFTAVQEQLGLRLDSGSAPLDVLIVDHVERPTAN